MNLLSEERLGERSCVERDWKGVNGDAVQEKCYKSLSVNYLEKSAITRCHFQCCTFGRSVTSPNVSKSLKSEHYVDHPLSAFCQMPFCQTPGTWFAQRILHFVNLTALTDPFQDETRAESANRWFSGYRAGLSKAIMPVKPR
jgi:hypothetical protein